MKEVVTFDKARKIWNRIVKSPDSIPLTFDIEIHKRILDLFHMGSCYYYIFNCATADFDYIDKNAAEVTGYQPEGLSPSFYYDTIHPEDSACVLDFEDRITRFYEDLPLEALMSYKSSYDYRIRTLSGRYIRILQQVTVIQTGDDGSVFRTFGVHTDITHLKPAGKPVLNIMELGGKAVLTHTGHSISADAPGIRLTKREMQVTRLIAEGHYNDQIAVQMGISVHTVKTHRKNIMAKTQAKSPGELVSMGIRHGWF